MHVRAEWKAGLRPKRSWPHIPVIGLRQLMSMVPLPLCSRALLAVLASWLRPDHSKGSCFSAQQGYQDLEGALKKKGPSARGGPLTASSPLHSASAILGAQSVFAGM